MPGGRPRADTYHQRFLAAFVAWRWPERGREPVPATFMPEALRTWLGSRPEDAEDLQQVAIAAAAACLGMGEVDAAARLVDTGLEASLVGAVASDDRRSSTGHLALLGARLAFERDDVAMARVLADRARDAVDGLSGGPLLAYLRLHKALIEARLADAALEDTAAREAYRAATDLAASLSWGAQAEALLPAWSELAFGPVVSARADDAAPLLRAELDDATRLGLLGLARLSSGAQAARDAIDRCVADGLPLRESVLALVGVLDRLPPTEVAAAAARLAGVARGLGSGDTRAWDLAISAFALDARIGRGGPASGDLARTSGELGTRATRKGADPLASMLALAARARERYTAGDSRAGRRAIDRLLELRVESAGSLAGSRLELRARGAVEPALVAAWTEELAGFARDAGVEKRRRVTSLVDSLRWSDDARPSATGARAATGRLERAEALATDRLGRLTYAVTHGPHAGEVLVLVAQAARGGMSFLAVGGDDARPVAAIPPSPEALRALVVLGSAAEQRIAGAIADHRLTTLGRAAFDALPDAIWADSLRASTVMLLPDPAAGRDRIPFELLHDGTAFLGLSTVMTRCLSLSHALRVLEPALVPPVTGRRALCVAVAAPPGLPDLPRAAEEPALVRDALGSGWDAELLLDSAAEPEAVLELAPLASVLHVACHGDSAPGAEALVLADGRRLRAIDIATRHRVTGIVYINACSLGSGRYVGGGVSRGAAYAFARAGAPTVIANLLPVLDDSAQALATSFYTEAHDHGVGEALRRARVASSDGTSPALWSTTVLLGDPFRRIDGEPDVAPDATARLFHGQAAPPKARLKAAVAATRDDPDDVRLAAAVELSTAVAEGSHDPEVAARVAREIGHDIGEAQHLVAAAQMTAATGTVEAQQEALRSAMAALKPLRGRWEPAREAYLEADETLRRLDPTYMPRELPTFRYESGLTVNDRSDPAVDAILSLNEAMFEHEQFWRGDPAFTVPDLDARSTAHNALVWGWTYPVYESGAESAFARACAERLAWRGAIDVEAVQDLHRIWAGLLCFLWGQQKVKHLEEWLLRAQTAVLQIAITRAGHAWASGPGAAAAPFLDEVVAVLNQLDQPADVAGAPGTPATSRFARARAAMETQRVGGRVVAVTDKVVAAIEACHTRDPFAAADLAAWTMGDVLERESASTEAREPRQAATLALRSLVDRLERRQEDWLMPYLVDGFAGERASAGMNLLERWSSQSL